MADAPDPTPADRHDVRAREVLARMTLQEKVAQIVGLWGEDGGCLRGRFTREKPLAKKASLWRRWIRIATSR